MRKTILFLLIVGLAACASTQPGRVSQHDPQSIPAEEVLDSQLNEQTVKVLVTEKRLSGEEQINLETTIFKPDGDGPFPLLVLSHGSPRGGESERRTMKRARYINQSREFIKMGFVVVIPMRRGYGHSEGNWAEDYDGCSHPMYYKAGLEGAKDLIAVVNYMKKLLYVDGRRVVLAGQSAGGFASLAAASMGFDGLMGVINFSGGRGSARPDFICEEHLLVDAMGKYSSTSRVPTLWHYSENDHYISKGVAKMMFTAYTNAGGRGILVMQPAFEKDGHLIFSKKEGIPYWLPEVRKFLTSLGLILD
jgi:dienelactone hydrolase